VRKWWRLFKEGRNSVLDEERNRYPVFGKEIFERKGEH
jgi:hypothetical protein